VNIKMKRRGILLKNRKHLNNQMALDNIDLGS
jgi:hypothetical protein